MQVQYNGDPEHLHRRMVMQLIQLCGTSCGNQLQKLNLQSTQPVDHLTLLFMTGVVCQHCQVERAGYDIS